MVITRKKIRRWVWPAYGLPYRQVVGYIYIIDGVPQTAPFVKIGVKK